MSKPIIKMYDGHVSTRTVEGELTAIHLLSTLVNSGINKPRHGLKLIGFGNGRRHAAIDLVAQLRLYADWIAYEHGLPVADSEKLFEQVTKRTGVPLRRTI